MNKCCKFYKYMITNKIILIINTFGRDQIYYKDLWNLLV